MSETASQIAAIRAFNRFYTRVIGLLEDSILKSPFALAEARVIHEIGEIGCTTSAALSRRLGMDPGQLSRLTAKLVDRGVIVATPSPSDARATDLRLTPPGEFASSVLNRLSDAEAGNLIAPLAPPQRQAVVGAMQTITDLLAGRDGPDEIFIRDHHQIGELGWLILRQAALYHQEHGWNGEFEALISRIYAEFEDAPQSPPKRLWIAEKGGAIAGSVFVLPATSAATTAQLRMLYAEPFARGSGLGRRLVGEAVAFARISGYARIMLWTQDCLVAARRVYQSAGFRLVREERHFSFGKELNGQFWELELAGDQ